MGNEVKYQAPSAEVERSMVMMLRLVAGGELDVRNDLNTPYVSELAEGLLDKDDAGAVDEARLLKALAKRRMLQTRKDYALASNYRRARERKPLALLPCRYSAFYWIPERELLAPLETLEDSKGGE